MATDAPYPWRQPSVELVLVDANGFSVAAANDGAGTATWIEVELPFARELIRAAPEMESALRFFVEMTSGMAPIHPKVGEARRILAALDAARKAGP